MEDNSDDFTTIDIYKTHLYNVSLPNKKFSQGESTVTMDTITKHPVSENQEESLLFEEYNASDETRLTWHGIVCIHDPHSRGVGHCGHAWFLSLLLVSINNEECQ